eukprot:scaffold1124_cov361-Prasinococcus_capsulatus_cf.AAC.26
MFDFYEWQANLKPLEKQLQLPVTQDGFLNAIAFWFELQLDEQTMITNSPFAETGGTWSQAVQYCEELRVRKGDSLPVVAMHNTYSISFKLDDTQIDRAAVATRVPLWDPAWHVQFQHMEKINSDFLRTIAQNPLEYRQAAEAAVAMGARPMDVGLECDVAQSFCSRMMG